MAVSRFTWDEGDIVIVDEPRKGLKYSDDQERDERGRWTSGGGADAEAMMGASMELRIGVDGMLHDGTPQDPVPVGADLDRAVQLIADGSHVRLDQPEQISTLLEKMAAEVERITAAGEEKPLFDLCNVSVEGTNLFCADSVTRSDGTTIDRIEMPQFATDTVEPGSLAESWGQNQFGEYDGSTQFAEFLAETSRDVEDVTIDPALLRASQGELVGEKVAGIMGAIERGEFDPKVGTIWITRDNYVIDGHHRWAAIVAEGYRTGEPIEVQAHRIDVDIGTALTVASFWTQEVGLSGKAAKGLLRAMLIKAYLARP